MARIQTYTVDTVINPSDTIIGTDGAEGANYATKNFTIANLTSYLQGALTDIEVVGLKGPQGDPGPKGDPGAVGPAGLEWQGTWVSGNNYAEDDAVAYDGASYFCIADATGETTAPDADTTHWALLASQGANGDLGDRGPRGYGIASSSGAYYNNLGEVVSPPTDDSEYKVKLTFDDGTILTTDDIRGPKGDPGNVVGTGTVRSVGVDTGTPLSIAPVGSIPGTNPITSAGVITMAAANGSLDGYLTSTDWNTFNNKVSGTATTGNTAPNEIRVMTEAEHAALVTAGTTSATTIYVLT